MKIGLLNQTLHNREAFSCGIEELDKYLKKYALQDLKRNLTKVFVLEGKSSGEIVGYYTLSPLSFSKEGLRSEISKKLPHYPIPAILLGRLAVSFSYQKKGLGTLLLMDALLRIYRVSQESFGIYGVVVDAKNDQAKAFYEHFGFISFLDKKERLFISLDTIKGLFKSPPKNHQGLSSTPPRHSSKKSFSHR